MSLMVPLAASMLKVPSPSPAPSPAPSPPPSRAGPQSLPPGKAGEKHLLLWSVEDAVKSRYSQFVGLLEATSTDTLDYLKVRGRRRGLVFHISRASSCCFALLRGRSARVRLCWGCRCW